MHYSISYTEIVRRKKAYITLSVNLIIGLLAGSIVFRFPISIFFYAAMMISLYLIGAFSFAFFRKLLQTTIYFDGHYLIKTTRQTSEKYALSTIKRVEIKWTTQKTIREIYIWLHKQQSVFITALNDFESFRNELLQLSHVDNFKEKYEPIPYDHPLFYIVLGESLGFLSVGCYSLCTKINFQHIHMLITVLFMYSVGLGIYFFVAIPTSKRSGKNTILFDYLAGSVLVGLGLLMLFLR